MSAPAALEREIDARVYRLYVVARAEITRLRETAGQTDRNKNRREHE